MTPEQLRALQETVAESIEKNVNGKIRRLDEKIDNYIREDNEHKERMILETAEWRKSADEKLQLVSNIQGFGKVLMYFLGFCATLGGVIAMVVTFFHEK